MLDLIARLAIASTALACSTFAFIACDTSLAPTPTTAPDDGELAIAEATLESGATVGWDFDIALETVASQFPTVLDISIPVDLEPAVPTRIPRAAAAAGTLETVDALARPVGNVGEVRLLDALTHEVLFAAPVDADRRASTAWIDVRLANPCKGRVFCQRPFRLEVSRPGPTATHITADLTDAVSHGRVILGR